MPDVTIKKVSEVSYYQGPKAIPGMKFRTAGRELGVTAWGMNVIEIDAGCEAYPEHDHASDGQEEVYVVLAGSGTLEAGADAMAIEQGTMVRVPPSTKRKFLPGAQGLTLLALGGIPGQAYKPR